MARPNNFPPTARHAAREARQAAADERAAKLAPLVKALQAAGVTSPTALRWRSTLAASSRLPVAMSGTRRRSRGC
jgi:hypothetical protein